MSWFPKILVRPHSVLVNFQPPNTIQAFSSQPFLKWAAAEPYNNARMVILRKHDNRSMFIMHCMYGLLKYRTLTHNTIILKNYYFLDYLDLGKF